MNERWRWAWGRQPHFILPIWEHAGSGAQDISGRARHAPPFSAAATPTWTRGAVGPALAFDETDDRLEMPVFQYADDQATVTPELTLAIRFQLRNTAGTFFQYLFSQGVLGSANTINVYYREDGATSSNETTVQIRLNGGASATQLLTGISVTDTLSHSYVLTLDRTDTVRVFWDGALVASASALDGTGYAPADDIRIGANRLGGGGPSADRYFGGLLEFMGMFQGAWNADQVRTWHKDVGGPLARAGGFFVGVEDPGAQPTIPPELLSFEHRERLFDG